MYIVGGVEVLLMYIVPDMAIGGREALHDTDPLGPLYNNYRIYGTLFLLIQVAIVAMGVKFVQLLAPVSFPSLLSQSRSEVSSERADASQPRAYVSHKKCPSET
ncbi:hypothetical protein COOONC_24600 [Cooperia oncophora]